MLKKRPILRALALLVAAASLLGLLEGQRLFPQAKAETVTPYRWFYDQLREGTMEKEFYDALLHMLDTGILDADGSYEIPLSSNPAIAAAMVGFSGNMAPLINAMAKARDGFECDYPDVFWVDFSMLTINVTLDTRQEFHVYLGTGRGDSYFLPGITAADLPGKKAEYESAMTSALAWIREQKPGYDDEPESKTLATAAHDYLTTHMVYHFEYESDATTGVSSCRTAYDALVYQEGVCEAYTRAYKALLDRLGVESVSVTGTYYVSPGQFEPHAWSNVKINGQWYGVDVTHDDPRIKDFRSYEEEGIVYLNARKSGYENASNLLLGDLELSKNHYPQGVMSPASYADYAYPMMAQNTYRREDAYSGGGINVRIVEDTDSGGIALFNYNNKCYWENVDNGYYFVIKWYDQWTEDGPVKESDWAYMTPELYGNNIVDVKDENDPYYHDMGGSYTHMPLNNLMGFKLGITTQKPDMNPEAHQKGSLYLDYYGLGEKDLISVSEMIPNFQFEAYAPAPFPYKVTPTQTSGLKLGGTYHVRAEFNQDLELVEGQQVAIEYESAHYDIYANLDDTSRQHTRIENVTFDGKNVIEFDFTPSPQFNDNDTIYNIYFKNVIGVESRKEPMNITYVGSARECATCYRSQGYDWNVFGAPHLLESEDIVGEGGFVVKDIDTGETSLLDPDIADRITHRLSLVTVDTSPGQNQAMLDSLEGDDELMDEIGGSENIVTTKTYNIKLALCKMMVLETGQGVRVSMGFPEGTTYEDFADTGTLDFKAYHYVTNPDGSFSHVEEIPITVTPRGLILLIDSFSPFTIAAVRSDPAAKEDKPVTVIVTYTDGGTLTDINGNLLAGANSVVTLADGEQKTVVIQANEGYQISSITVGGKVYTVEEANKALYNFTLTSEMAADLKTDGTFLVEFIADSTADSMDGEISVANGAGFQTPVKLDLENDAGTNKHDHSPDDAKSIFVWDGDKCTYNVVCAICGDTYESHDATVEAVESTDNEASTCEKNGKQLYKATYGDKSAEKLVTLPKTAHSYGSDGKCTVCGAEKPCNHVYSMTGTVWNDNGTCEGTFSCGVCGKNDFTMSVPYTTVPVKPATCTEDGENQNTAYFTIGSQTFPATQPVTLPKIEHNYNEEGVCTMCGEKKDSGEHVHTLVLEEYDWDDSLNEFVLHLVCTTCHIEIPSKIDGDDVQVEEKAATCTEDGYKLYVAEYNGERLEHIAETIEKLGHDYVNGYCTRCHLADPDHPSVDPDPSGPSAPSVSPQPDIPGPTATSAPTTTPATSPEDTPKTGDETNFVILFVLLGASAVGVGISVYLLRKKPKDRKRSK